METSFIILIGMVAATICAFVASSKRRNVAAYSALGFFFPLIGIIAVLCVSRLGPVQLPQRATHELYPPYR